MLLRLSSLKGVACGREVVEYRVEYAVVTSQRYFSVERLLLSVTGKMMVGASKYSDALQIPVEVLSK